ncbi:MAG: polysaccharide deacetylase family protein [Litorimonas sp.]
MSVAVYEPRRDLLSKVTRRSARLVGRRTVTPTLARGLVSLSFDDCPRSVFETALPMIERKGWRATIYASMGLCGTTNHLGLHMSETDLVDAHAAGHEIGDHTYSHLDTLAEGTDALMVDVARNRDAFQSLGLPRATTFAFPYGEVTPNGKSRLSREFGLLRGIHAPRGPSLDLNLAACGRLYSDALGETLKLIETAARNRSWLILFGHDVRTAPSPFGCTPYELAIVVDRIESLGLDVATVADGLRRVSE